MSSHKGLNINTDFKNIEPIIVPKNVDPHPSSSASPVSINDSSADLENE
jgi:hypothetical protein